MRIGAEPRSGRRGWPIAVVLFAGVAGLLLVAVALVLVAGHQVARSNTVELIRDKGELVIDAIEQRVRGHLDPVRAQLDYLAKLIEGGPLTPAERPDLGPLLLASLAAVPQVSTIALVDPELRLWRAFRNRIDAGLVRSDWGDDPGFQRLMTRVAAAESPFWGELFVAEGAGLTLVNLFVPLRAEGHYLGALVAGVSIYDLSRFLATFGDVYLENAFILHGRDSVLAHPDMQEVRPGLSDAQPLPALDRFGDGVLAAIWSEDHLVDEEADFANGIEARVVDLGDGRHVFLFRQLEGYGDAPWQIGTYFRLDTAAPQLARLAYIGWAAVVVLVLAMPLALLLGHSLGRPIRQLSHAVEKVRDLDLESAPPTTGPYRELNEMNEAYRSMVEGLRHFATYVPRPLVRRLIQARPRQPAESEEREVTILLTDLMGFTSFAENLPANQVADFLNRHFTTIAACVEVEEGIVDKYIGDAMLAFWGAPSAQPDHASRACRAALAIAHAMGERIDGGDLAGPRQLRVAIHTGTVIVGDIGAPGRVNYTIIGDAVNAAERLEELARQMASLDDPVYVLVSGVTTRQLRPDLRVTPLGRHALRGRHEPLEVFRLEIDGVHDGDHDPAPGP
jgi:adenylate cyclase